jgi:hypothetical protein
VTVTVHSVRNKDLTRSENRPRSVTNRAYSICALSASNLIERAVFWRASTRTRCVRVAFRAASSRQGGRKRRLSRSQTNSVSSQRARPCSLPGAVSRIGDQYQSPIAQRRGIATLAIDEPVKRHLKPQFAPQMARCQHRSPIPRRHGVDILAPDRGRRLAMQQARMSLLRSPLKS